MEVYFILGPGHVISGSGVVGSMELILAISHGQFNVQCASQVASQSQPKSQTETDVLLFQLAKIYIFVMAFSFLKTVYTSCRVLHTTY